MVSQQAFLSLQLRTISHQDQDGYNRKVKSGQVCLLLDVNVNVKTTGEAPDRRANSNRKFQMEGDLRQLIMRLLSIYYLATTEVCNISRLWTSSFP